METKMALPKFSVIALFQLVFLVVVTIQADMCGMPQPDPMKTCISVRLPWNPAPMYFCTDKSTFRYKNQCQNRYNNQCGLNSIRQDTLMVASPWDCCPLVSFPDSCVNQQCPPAPLNRKYQTMEPNANQPFECCNSYFCEENMTPDTCHFKRLEPHCNMPPEGKKNCVAFVDIYGCCPKFQCDGDAKPGHCPAQAAAMKFMARFNSTNMMMIVPGMGMPMMPMPGMNQMNGMGNMGNMGNNMGMGAGAMSPAGQAEMHMENKPADAAPPPPPAEAPPAAPPAPEAPPAERGGPMNQPLLSKVAGAIQGFMGTPTTNQIACVGDFNCPGNMKCCSHDMNVYVMDNRYVFRNRNPTYGYCMEAVMHANQMNTKNLKYVSQK